MTGIYYLIKEVNNFNSNQGTRLSKLLREEFYLLSYEALVDNKKKGIFKVAGSTKNVYTVTWYNNSFFCDCPDQKNYCKKQNCICKHVCFVVCRIGKVYSKDFSSIKHSHVRKQMLCQLAWKPLHRNYKNLLKSRLLLFLYRL